MKVVWSKEALYRFIEREAFIAEDNEGKAVEFTDYLVDQTLMIVDNPKMGGVVPEFMDSNIRELLINGD